jgi:hypothetical protein
LLQESHLGRKSEEMLHAKINHAIQSFCTSILDVEKDGGITATNLLDAINVCAKDLLVKLDFDREEVDNH